MHRTQNRLEELIHLLEKAISLLPIAQQDQLKLELKALKELIMDSRPPRILVLGRRGAGKSSLINAIFGQALAEVGSVKAETVMGRWYTYSSARGSMEIMDTRGLGDVSQGRELQLSDALAGLKNELHTLYPDVILFLNKAKEVDSRIQEDLKQLVELRNFIQYRHQYTPPVLAVVTQVDELDPVDITQPPYDDPEKQANIRKALKTLEDAFHQQSIKILQSVAISAYARYRDKELVSQRYWNIDTLLAYLLEALPRSAQLELARISQMRHVQKRIARIIITSAAAICSGLAATPLPIADMVPITGAQVGMIAAIAYLAGRDLNQQSALEFLTALGVNVGAGFALREISRALAKFIFPGGGSLISSGIAFAATWGIGEAAIAYFIEGNTLEEAQKVYRNVKTQKEER